MKKLIVALIVTGMLTFVACSQASQIPILESAAASLAP